MEGNYPMYFGSRTIGRADVKREGLYYRFYCRCRLTGDVIFRVLVRCSDKERDLGILIPADGGFSLNTRLPVKHFPEGKPEFSVIPHGGQMPESFIPIRPEEPFAYIEKLKHAYLATREGQMGALIRK